MIVFTDLVLGPADGEHAEKISKFLDKYRDRKNELAYYSSMAQDMCNQVTMHVQDNIGSFHYSSGSFSYNEIGQQVRAVNNWSEEDINDPDSAINQLHKWIQVFHKTSGYESDTDDFVRYRAQGDFFTFMHGGIITYYPYGPNPDPVEYRKYMEHVAKTDEINKFAHFLHTKGYKAHVVRGGVIDIYHNDFDFADVFKEGPLATKNKIYLFTSQPSNDIMNFPEGTEVILINDTEELLKEVSRIMKETKK